MLSVSLIMQLLLPQLPGTPSAKLGLLDCDSVETQTKCNKLRKGYLEMYDGRLIQVTCAVTYDVTMQPTGDIQHRSIARRCKEGVIYLHEAQQACTMESLAQVFTNDIWVILVNLGQEHKCWDFCTAPRTNQLTCQLTSQSARQLQHTVVALHMHSIAWHIQQISNKEFAMDAAAPHAFG